MLRGPYLGDVSALCFLPSSPLPYLIAGSIFRSELVHTLASVVFVCENFLRILRLFYKARHSNHNAYGVEHPSQVLVLRCSSMT